MKVKIKLQENAIVPFKATKGAACHDVVARSIEFSNDGRLATVKLGIHMTPPSGFKIVFVPRSGLTSSPWVLQNSPAQGDEDYTGEYMLKFRYIGKEGVFAAHTFPYQVGQRCAQMFIEKVYDFDFEIVDSLNETDRNEGGFGSTGI